VIGAETTKSIWHRGFLGQAIGAHNLKDGVQRGFAFDLRMKTPTSF